MSFGRRTWDREKYALLAESGGQEKGLNLSTDALTKLQERYTDHKKLVKSLSLGLKEKHIVTGLTSTKRGKQFGFYCELCHLTFMDSLQFIDHLNHQAHAVRFESLFREPLVKDLRDNDEVPLEEFIKAYDDSIYRFTQLHENKRISRQRRSKRPVKGSGQPSNMDNKMIEHFMGFSSFNSSRR